MAQSTKIRLANGLLGYDPLTGNVWWEVSRSNRVKTGVPLNANQCGYVYVRIDGVLTAVHRLICEELYGKIPDGLEVNHKNGVRHDNRAENLEVVTHAENVKHARRTGLTPISTMPERAVVGVHPSTGDGLFFKSIKTAHSSGYRNINTAMKNSWKCGGFYWSYYE